MPDTPDEEVDVPARLREIVERNRVTWEPSVAECHRLLDEFSAALGNGEHMRVVSCAAGLHAVVDSLAKWAVEGLVRSTVMEAYVGQKDVTSDMPEPVRQLLAGLRSQGAEVEVVGADGPGHYI